MTSKTPLAFRSTRRAAACLLLALASFASVAAEPGPNGFDIRGALIPAQAIQRGGPPRDGIPAIDRPRFVPAAQSGLADGDRVLGLALGGVARAYPVRILNWHEIVNDRIDGRPVAVTYCPLCGTGVAFDARIAGRDAVFGVSGLLYNSDVLLYDRSSESLWSQLMAQAISGPLKGTKLQPLPMAHTSWAAWRARHPKTQVLSTDTGFMRDYTRNPYDGYEQVRSLMFEVEHRDERFPAKEWVLGLRLGGAARAWPFSVLAQRVDAEGRLRERVGGQDIEIRYDRVHRSAAAYDAAGQALPGVTAYWFAWVAFNPKTSVLTAH